VTVRNELDWKFADAVYSGTAFGIRTKSGDGGSAVDDQGATHFLGSYASNIEIGTALRDCLEHSRLLSGESRKKFFEKVELRRNELSWRNAQVANMNSKSFSILRKKIAGVGLLVTRGSLYLKPTINRYGRIWLYLPDRDTKDIQLPYPSDNETIGAALREAFRRCEGTGRADLSFEGWPDDSDRVWASPANPLKPAPPPLLVSPMPTRQSVPHQVKVSFGGNQSR
jgi:CDI immunity protein